ncbi:putative thylakoidal processing peptidase 2, chloroplastic [Gossypium australe]|uniref:Putative thylakoidal processing peptidase 2, chloroplastic n=1 Tax=Gossypium australe TaxID=47621 RepID=A0A5B6U2L4_9ROSI|nr:putative thylakoidal processing peptidase 2, chloroplastic [Gossypium australe]
MMSRRLFSFLLFFLFSPILSFAFNPLHSNNPQILQDVIEKIALKQKWELEGLNFSKLELSKVRFGTGKRYEFRIRFGKTHLLFKFPDEVSSLKKFTRRSSDDFLDFVNEINSSAVLEPFTMEGPFELRLSPGHQASLLFPSEAWVFGHQLNTSHTDLKRVLVGHGITLHVIGAQEISLFHTFNFGSPANENGVKEKSSGYWPFSHSFCRSLLPVHVLGSVSLAAYRTRNPDAHIEAHFPSKDTIELLPEKCYGSDGYTKQPCPIDSISLRIARNNQKQFLCSLNVKIKASPIVHFQLELEKEIGNNESVHSMLAEWRTKPTVERLWFDVMTRIEGDKLKPLTIKKINAIRHYLSVESSVDLCNICMSLMSNPPWIGFERPSHFKADILLPIGKTKNM